jgi:hypothetical protein
MLFLLPLMLGGGGIASAADVYRWIDQSGEVHLGNVRPEGMATTLVYRGAPGGRIFQWQDETGQVHFGDAPPEGTAKPREILIEPLTEPAADPDEYSIVRQAERMAEDRRRIEEARILRERMRFEESRLARDMAVLRMQEQIRTRGYGPRPDPFPYSYAHDHSW